MAKAKINIEDIHPCRSLVSVGIPVHLLVERQTMSVRHAVKSLYIYLHIVVTEIVEGDVGSSKLTVVIFVKLIFGYSSSPMRRRPFYRFRI